MDSEPTATPPTDFDRWAGDRMTGMSVEEIEAEAIRKTTACGRRRPSGAMPTGSQHRVPAGQRPMCFGTLGLS